MSLKNNKKSLYILLPAVLALWGYIIFQVASGMNQSTDFISSKPVKIQKTKTQDTLLLSLNYSDPFKVRNSSYTYQSKPKEKKKPKKKIAPVKTQVIWPSIDYQGRMANVSTGKITAILVINGEHYMLKEKEKLNGLKVVHCWKDSVKLKYEGKAKVFLK